jgi:alanine racemase
MNRIGFSCDETGALEAAAVFTLPKLCVKGAFTHFSRADEQSAAGDAFTALQYERFAFVIGRLLELGCDPGFLHACNSAAAIRFPEFALDGVRLGIALYGAGDLSPDNEPLEPVMSLYTKITHIHTLPSGEPLGYGASYTAINDREIATLPIGYADGFIRAYSGAWVQVKTAQGYKKARIVGRICMDQCMIDVTGLGAMVGDTVRIFGGDREDIRELARLAGTIDYECLCTVSARVQRIIKY